MEVDFISCRYHQLAFVERTGRHSNSYLQTVTAFGHGGMRERKLALIPQ